jgi:phenylalanyl-tRNA synthetase beta chain
MKISLNWLKEYLGNIKDNDELISRLTSMGLEVDSVSKQKRDTVIDIDMTPNRADCLSVMGIARDLSPIYKKKVLMPKISKLSNKTKSHVKRVNKKISTAYSILVIEDFDNSLITPKNIADRLELCGISQINFIVDVLNYVMLEIGQPMHVFDKDKLNGALDVRFARKGEKINALDGNQYTLTADIPVISDSNGAQAISGVIGSDNSSVDTNTSSIIIESAFFNQNLIRKSAKKYRLQTESSYRFERGVDPYLNNLALGRVMHIVDQYSQVKNHMFNSIVSKPISTHLGKYIKMDISYFERILGVKLSNKFIINTLSYLGFNPIIVKNKLKVSVPSHRFDISIAEDIVEEVARVYGYNNFTEIPLPPTTLSKSKISKNNTSKYLELLSSQGYHEVITYSFLPKDSQKLFMSNTSKIEVLNPISEDKSEMRVNMINGLLKTAKYNISRQNSDIKIFEIGKTYKKHKDNSVSEENVLAGMISGVNYPLNLKQFQRKLDFYDLKGDLMSIFQNLSFNQSEKISYLSNSCQAVISQGRKPVGLCGEPSLSLYKQFGVKNKIFYFEIYIDLLKLNQKVTYEPISIYPKIYRDLTLLFDSKISSGDIIKKIQRKSFNYMINSRISDIFYNKNDFGNDKKSMTLELVFQDYSRTLQDDDVNTQISMVLDFLEKEFNAVLRK